GKVKSKAKRRLPPHLSKITTARHWPSSSLRERCIPVTPASRQSWAARPLTLSSGLPLESETTSTSRQKIPPCLRPTPRALEKASLAAKRRAKQESLQRLPWQWAISWGVKTRFRNRSP